MDKVILVGKEFQLADPEKQFLQFIDTDEALGWLKENSIDNHLVLIKGSRGIQLEKLLEAL